MKVTLNWLREYVEFDWSPEELAERLTMLGLEVESVTRTGADFPGVVVAEVLAKDKHPNADKLTVCRVNDGQGERQIVCGAHNFKAGDKVPLVLPGATLPGKPGQAPLTIKVGKIRGVESHGMMCSPQELGMGGDVEGLLILKPDARPGQSFAEYVGGAKPDVIYDLEVTPNRPDLNSVIGVAREISAVTGNPLKLPDATINEPAAGEGERLVNVRLEDPVLCPRYTARVIRGVKIGPSPDWLKNTLESVGIRSINNVVDVTNYVMMETGQPLHAFDYHLIAASAETGLPTIVVRRATAGEIFVTLDGQQRQLKSENLLIADETKAVALAGVMGGQNTEIRDDTRDVLLESAYFKPQNIRATSKAMDLRTESSYRFERGADPGASDWASRRAAHLIIQTAGGSLPSGVVDACPVPAQPKQITLRHAKVNELLGLDLRPDQIEAYLAQLELRPVSRKPRPVGDTPSQSEPVTLTIPTFRVDLKREVDLIEEVARLYGVDRIPSTPPRGAIGSNAFDAKHDELAEVRRILTGLGLYEAQGQTLISDTSARLFAGNRIVALANPLSSDMNVLRPALLPGLLDILRHNLSRKNEEIALFEVGRVFTLDKDGAEEQRRLAIALSGQRNALFWSGADRGGKMDLWDLKGVLEEFFDHVGLRGCSYIASEPGESAFLESADIQLGRLPIGRIGQLNPTVAKQYDLRDTTWLAEIDLDMVLYRRISEKTFSPLPAFPPIRRDIAIVVAEPTTHESVLHAVKQTRPAHLESVDLFDIFHGKNIPEGQKSMAYAFIYRHKERTLTDAEVNAEHERVVAALKEKLHASIRE
jgi:phenylalanyl-tRNA synthetase beta chain